MLLIKAGLKHHDTLIQSLGRCDVVYAGDEGRPYCQAMGGKREVGEGKRREVGGLWRLAKKLKREEHCQNMLPICADKHCMGDP